MTTVKKRNTSTHVLLESRLKACVQKLQEVSNQMLFVVDEMSRADLDAQSDEQKRNFYDEVQRYEMALIADALARTAGRQKEAAQLLGLRYTTFNAMIKRYDIQPARYTHQTESESSTRNTDEARYVF